MLAEHRGLIDNLLALLLAPVFLHTSLPMPLAAAFGYIRLLVLMWYLPFSFSSQLQHLYLTVLRSRGNRSGALPFS